MRNLLRFISNNSFIFIFILLELFSFSLLIKNNNYHNSSFFNSSNFLVGNLYATINNLNDYFNLKEVNKQLAEQNATLQSSSISSFTKVFGNTVHINDTTYKQRYIYTSAKIINNSTNKRNNYITLNKGAINGIEPGMGVISPTGVIGIVKNVSKNFSSVISVLHKNTKISGKIQKSGYYGSVFWNGVDYKTAELTDIPNHVKLSIGDKVVTSGYSVIFPENILIGKITSFSKPPGSNFYNISIELSSNFKNLSQAYVIKNLMKDEQVKLESENIEELDD